jgi:peptidoglycan/xylan/chitin deacetylase (PgdA/CDA1 family)
VEGGAQRLTELTGKRPLFFRSGTGYYDDVAVQVVAALGFKAVGFSVIGDAGATLPADKVAAILRDVRDGDIVILHFNRPKSGTYEGLRQALPELLARGIIFVHLRDATLQDTPR